MKKPFKITRSLKIARFEFLGKARTKAFVIFTVLFPVVIGAVSVVPALLIQNNKEETVRIGILDYTDSFTSEFYNRINEYRLSTGRNKYTVIDYYEKGQSLSDLVSKADKAVLDGIIKGYVLLEGSNKNLVASFRQLQLSHNKDEYFLLEKIVSQIIVNNKLSEIGYRSEVIGSLIQDVKLNPVQISYQEGDIRSAGFQAVFFPAMVSIMLLFMLILFSGGQLIRSIMEEKSSRIIEVLLSSVSAEELLTGKVLGLGMLGLFQVFIWIIFSSLLLFFKVIPSEMFSNIGLIMVYFALGYFLYTSIFVGAGSVVTTEQEAQHFTSYISLLMTIPLIISLKVIENPNLLFVRLLSYFPLTSPPVMLLRLKMLTPPLWEILLSIIILIAAICFTIYASAKIFRIGILSYGKRPSFKELFAWIKEK
ncbi:MAG: ABC transporter permease [Bacillota bacterium]